jgi:hypothetical protein
VLTEHARAARRPGPQQGGLLAGLIETIDALLAGK